MFDRLLPQLRNQLKGDIHTDIISRTMYATDASVYKELPLAVVYPKDTEDVIALVHFAKQTSTSLIPRAAGTSLAGQVVGSGIIVDVGRHMNKILEINVAENYAWVEPGVVLEELNQALQKDGLFFGPETSTANRCMIGGMLGNNACGLHSLIYGSTRDHTLAVEGILSDGSVALFEDLSVNDLNKKLTQTNLEGSIYKKLVSLLGPNDTQQLIRNQYPDPNIPRRNTGYAIDLLLNMLPFRQGGQALNMSKLLGGSEGTLVFSTRIKLNLVPLPPSEKGVICAHFSDIQETLHANLLALKHQPTAIELMDHHVLECTKSNREQEANRFFVTGDPKTILIIEFAEHTKEQLNAKISETIASLKDKQYGYAFPVVYGSDINKVWNLRKAGLGLLSNVPGDAKSVTVIEDTAVHVKDLPDYIEEIEEIFRKNAMTCVYHAHIGTGELHLRPILNLKSSDDLRKFRLIAEETVQVVKKYRGSFSGEHGDGRLRGTFIKDLFGEEVYGILKDIKHIFDPDSIFNPGKIIDSPPMDESLRYSPEQVTPDLPTLFDFSESKGIIRFIEKCNGSGDCRKSHLMGGAMCPSYQATRDERNTTRARANILREFINQPNSSGNPFDHPEVYEILDLCLSCKACKSECPSSVDMAKLKAEFLSHWYESHRIPLRTHLIANIHKYNQVGSFFPSLTNWTLSNNTPSNLIKRMAGLAAKRSLPLLSNQPFLPAGRKEMLKINPSKPETKQTICLFIDEFTNFNDAHIGFKTIRLLTALGYRILLPRHKESARTYLSKGLLKKAKKIIHENISLLQPYISSTVPLVGIEPSAILGFRDEYPELADKEWVNASRMIAENSFTIEEFLASEILAGAITSDQFSTEHKKILVHGHCQQKAVSSVIHTLEILALPKNYIVEEIPSGCCGMAGSFGYEKEHYQLSMDVGELVLFPAIRNAEQETIICASGTSCRHQIKDGTKRNALHPVEILYHALNI